MLTFSRPNASSATASFMAAVGGCFALALLVLPELATAGDWTSWRGPTQRGVSAETGLPSSWSQDGENLAWRTDFIGRATPVIHRGRLFTTGRAGEGNTRREVLAAFDAETGEPLWERTLTTQLTTVPYNRAGWAGPIVDPETGLVYAQGVAGPVVAYDRDGELVWEHLMSEEFGRFSGYGGRTQSPIIDEDLLIVSNINSSWGPLGRPTHRYYAFDKGDGRLVWISTPGGFPYDRNTSSNITSAVIDGQRMLITGNADGHIYALQARTGKKIWSFELSKRGINSSPIVVGETVIIGHSEENVDEATLGRLVAIDATGSGDVTKTHEKWRRDIKMGFPSPLEHEGRLYVMDNSANLMALDLNGGETIWETELGTVGKAAPVWADGKLYVTEVNGLFWILEDKGDAAEVLDREYVEIKEGRRSRYAEIYGSPAVAYGRVYFTTEEGIYALAEEGRAFEVRESAAPPQPAEKRGSDDVAQVLLLPAETIAGTGESVDYEVRVFNEVGRRLEPAGEASWSLEGLPGAVTGNSASGKLTVPAESAASAGVVKVRVAGHEVTGRVRVFPPLPWSEDFDDITGRGRPYWLGLGRYQVVDGPSGGKMLEKPVAEAGLLRSNLFLGTPYLSNYTVQADVRGGQAGRRMTDVGLVNQGYFLDLLGNGQKLELRTWSAVKRMAVTIPFEWDVDAWYTLKLRVEAHDSGGRVLGKVWKRGESEPAEWTITAEDPMPNRYGTPGLQGYSPAPVAFDNVTVTPN